MAKPHSLYVVTGASGALGSAFVGELATRGGVDVLTVSRRSAGDSRSHVQCDVASPESVGLIRSRAESFGAGRVHVINCLGFFPGYMRLADTSSELFERTLRDNLLSTFNSALALLPLMESRLGGHFIAFSAHTLYQSYPLMSLFDAAKAGVEQLIRQIANEYSKSGVQSNAFALSTLDTPEERKLKPFGDHARWLEVGLVAKMVVDFVEGTSGPSLVNGNVIHLYQYSDSYFRQSYFERTRAKDEVEIEDSEKEREQEGENA